MVHCDLIIPALHRETPVSRTAAPGQQAATAATGAAATGAAATAAPSATPSAVAGTNVHSMVVNDGRLDVRLAVVGQRSLPASTSAVPR
jgi:hypothetical protein